MVRLGMVHPDRSQREENLKSKWGLRVLRGTKGWFADGSRMVRRMGVLKEGSVEGLGKVHGKVHVRIGRGFVEGSRRAQGTGLQRVWSGVRGAKGLGLWRVHEDLRRGSAESLQLYRRLHGGFPKRAQGTVRRGFAKGP